MHELSKMTACQVVELLKKRKVTPVELIEVSAERMDAVEPHINAIPTRCLERAVPRLQVGVQKPDELPKILVLARLADNGNHIANPPFEHVLCRCPCGAGPVTAR